MIGVAFLAMLLLGSNDAAIAEEPTLPTAYQSVVTATRTPAPVDQVPASVTVINREELDSTPNKLLDETLRDVPSFGAFRRSSSAIADPTSQGLSLRGVGPSGVSRSLVLVDGVPETDAFGGWVYWRSLPALAIERIEIVPGSGSALFGNYALGGIVHIINRAPDARAIDVDAEAGSEQSSHVAARVADRWRLVGAAVDGEYFRSDGYQVVAPYARGPIDHSAASDHATANGRVEVYATPRLRLFASGGYFREQQDAGTPFSTATVQLGRYSAGLTWSPARIGRLDVAFFGHAEQFDQQRARVDATRSTAVQASRQSNPTVDIGDSLLFTSRRLHGAGTHILTFGHDFRWIEARPRELLTPAMPKPDSVVEREVAARQLLYGFFAQDYFVLGRFVDGALALRTDYWSNRDAHTTSLHAVGTSSETNFQDRGGWELTPRFGLVVRPVQWLAFRAAAYRSFRAPTMNELYRSFQVGTIVTAANAALTSETLWGGEVAVDITLPRLDVRSVGFANILLDPISNVSLPQPLADGAQRQRENLGSSQIVGVELSARWVPARRWTLQAAYTFVDATVRSAPAQPQLVGKQLAQDPHHRLFAAATFADARWFEVTAELRYASDQFDDDINQLRLPSFVLVNARVARRLSAHFDVFIAVENLLNQRYLIGRSGVDTVGEPLSIYGGIRYRAARR